jgi:hypothetical protein
MGYFAFQQLRQERESLLILSIIYEYLQDYPDRQGISAAEIVKKIKVLTQQSYTRREVARKIATVNEWSSVYGLDEIIIRDKNQDNGHIPIYRINDNMGQYSWEDPLKVVFAILLFRHGKVQTVDHLIQNPYHLPVLMNLLQALEHNKVIRIMTHDKDDRVVEPYRIGFNGGWKLYGIRITDRQEFSIPLTMIKRIVVTNDSFTKDKTCTEQIDGMILSL